MSDQAPELTFIQACARAEAAEAGTPIEPKDIKQFQRIESRNTGTFGNIEVIRRGVVTRINQWPGDGFTFYSGGDYLGGTSRFTEYTFFLLEEAPENPYPSEDAG